MNLKTIFAQYEYPAQSFAVFRILYASTMLIFGLPNYYWLKDLPDAFIHAPPSPLFFVASFPPELVFISLYFIGVLSFMCLLIGFHTKLASISAAAYLMIEFNLGFLLGQVQHFHFMFYVPFFMAFSNWGNAISIDGKKAKGNSEKNLEMAGVLALAMACSMFLSGLLKFLGGWLSLKTQASHAYLVYLFETESKENILTQAFLNLHNVPIWEFIDYFTVIFEMAFIVLWFYPALFRLLISITVLFHTAAFLIYGMGFWWNVLAYGIFVPWHKVKYVATLERADFFSAPKLWWTLVPFTYVIIFYSHGSPWWLIKMLTGIAIRNEPIVFTIGCVIVVMYYFHLIASRVRANRDANQRKKNKENQFDD